MKYKNDFDAIIDYSNDMRILYARLKRITDLFDSHIKMLADENGIVPSYARSAIFEIEQTKEMITNMQKKHN